MAVVISAEDLLTAPALIRVDLPPLCFGLVAEGGVIMLAPPVARWTVGRLVWRVCGYYRRRGATVTII